VSVSYLASIRQVLAHMDRDEAAPPSSLSDALIDKLLGHPAGTACERQPPGRDPGLVTETLRAVRAEVEVGIAQLEQERVKLRRQMGRDHGELTRLAKSRCKERTSRMADANERIGVAERRPSETRDELGGLQREVVSDDEVAAALAAFDGVWDALKPREQERVLDLLIESVGFDGAAGDLAITFRTAGIKTLAEEAA